MTEMTPPNAAGPASPEQADAAALGGLTVEDELSTDLDERTTTDGVPDGGAADDLQADEAQDPGL